MNPLVLFQFTWFIKIYSVCNIVVGLPFDVLNGLVINKSGINGCKVSLSNFYIRFIIAKLSC